MRKYAARPFAFALGGRRTAKARRQRVNRMEATRRIETANWRSTAKPRTQSRAPEPAACSRSKARTGMTGWQPEVVKPVCRRRANAPPQYPSAAREAMKRILGLHLSERSASLEAGGNVAQTWNRESARSAISERFHILLMGEPTVNSARGGLRVSQITCKPGSRRGFSAVLLMRLLTEETPPPRSIHDDRCGSR
jgi:hypothetical protein